MKKAKKLKGQKKKIKSPFKHQYDTSHFFNREMSWLEFNKRVLNEAKDSRTPLLERLRFLSIYTSNLDEFVMKRVGGLKRQQESEYNYISVDGLTSEQQLKKVREFILSQSLEQEATYFELKKELLKEKIRLIDWSDLSAKEIDFCNNYFLKRIFPILTPLSVDPGKPFPFISNLSMSLGILLEHPVDGDTIFSRVKVPSVANTWIRLESEGEELHLISGLEVIKHNLHHLYRGMKIIDVMPFRVTRNADWEHDDEDTEDLLELIEEAINERRLQEPIRLEVLKNCHEGMLKYLLDELELGPEDLYTYDKQLEFLNLGSLADLDIPRLKHSDWRPVTPPIFGRNNIFELIKERDRLVHHPYDNFSTTVEKFIKQASTDPKVLSIKMTLYRTGDNSPFIRSLILAAENGKQVVCLIELKARFDEKRNIFWAKKMEQAGVHVVYGVVGLKTHTKIAMVVRKELDGELVRYAHLATGNYNSKTSRLYTDIGLFTVDERLTTEVNEVFNYLTGTSLKMDYSELMVAPINAKSGFLNMIKAQETLARSGKPAYIVAKMNSMEDVAITEALYLASQAGVKITLYVRGFCCLRPQVKGLSDNIKVVSVIGRFLEHSRIFFFSDGEGEWSGKYFIGSADWMHRNMHARVEVMTPIYHEELKKKLADFLKVLNEDERSAWDLQVDGTYIQRKGNEVTGTHQVMMKKTLDDIKAIDL